MSNFAPVPSEPRDCDAIDVVEPVSQTAPVVFASPHSGANYPSDFLGNSRLTALALRRSEDAFVDELFAGAPVHGAPLLRALFPRAYLDPNREPFELDPEMFQDPLPAYANTRSPRVRGGLGTIARVVASGSEIYRDLLPFAEARHRIDTFYRPYHDALSGLIERTCRAFGACLVVDCHSMPSIGGPMDEDPGRTRVDFVLGDRYGTSCAPSVVERAQRTLEDLGYRVARNTPYAGGYTTSHYGRPEAGIHVLQIEINRRLYMDERAIEKLPNFGDFALVTARLTEDLVATLPQELIP